MRIALKEQKATRASAKNKVKPQIGASEEEIFP